MTPPDKDLAAALGRVPSGLFILTLRREAVATGMLASWVMQCSFDPPMVSVAIRRDREILGLLQVGSAFALNQLEEGQTDMIAHFGRGFRLSDDAFHHLDVDLEADSGPLLRESLTYMACEVVGQMPAGDHDIVLAKVTAGQVVDEGKPMIHVRKNGFHY